MLQRGRKSADVEIPNENIYRARAPKNLTKAQRAIWEMTVSRLGDEFFPPELLPLLSRYCCATVVSETLQSQLNDGRMSPTERTKLQTQFRNYTELMMQLATKLGITKSKHSTKRAKPTGNANPWQDEKDEG